MRLEKLHEGFNLGNNPRPSDRGKYSEIRRACIDLADICKRPHAHRISVIRGFIVAIRESISQITIDSADESKDIKHIIDILDVLTNILRELPDGPPYDDILYYISSLEHAISEFCIKYTRQ